MFICHMVKIRLIEAILALKQLILPHTMTEWENHHVNDCGKDKVIYVMYANSSLTVLYCTVQYNEHNFHLEN